MMYFLLLIIFIQIIAESLPISSSGHVALLSKFVAIHNLESVDYFLHLSTIVILMIVFYKDWSFLLSHLIKGFFNKKYSKYSFRLLIKVFFKIIVFIFVANLITSLMWLIVKNVFENQIWFNSSITLLIGFCITTFFLFLLKIKYSIFTKRSFLVKAFIVGFIQGFALIPGISRYASVYSTTRLLGIPKRRAFQVTFLLQFPLIVLGFGRGFYKLFKNNELSIILNYPVFLAIILATLISYFVFTWSKSLAMQNKLYRFAYYMFIPISLLLLFFIF